MQQLLSLNEIESAVNQYGEIVVCKNSNNNNNVVVMSMEEYKKQLNEKKIDEEIEQKILESEEDYNNGRVRDAEDVFMEWENKYGI